MHQRRHRAARAALAVLGIAAACRGAEPAVVELEEIVVVGRTSSSAPADRRVDAPAIALRGSADIAEAAALLPEVAMGRSGPRNEPMLFVRGFDLRQVPLFIDGIPVYVPYDGMADPGRFGTFDVASIRVSAGFTPMLYGPNTLGGAVNVVTRRPAAPWELRARAGAFSGGGIEGAAYGGARSPAGYAQGSVAYRSRDDVPMPGDFEPAPAEDGGRRENSDSRDRVIRFRAGWTPEEGRELTVGYARADSEKGIPPYAGSRPGVAPRFWRYPEWSTDGVFAAGRVALSPNAYLKPRLYLERYRNTLESYDDATYATQTRPYAFSSRYDDWTAGASVEAGIDRAGGHSTRAAFHYKRDVHRERMAGRPSSRFEDETLMAGIEDRVPIGGAWAVVSGLGYQRRDSIEAVDRSGPAPRRFPGNANDAVSAQAGVLLDAGGGVARATLAQAVRFPTLKDRYSFRLGQAAPNPGLGPERALHAEVGYAGPLGGGVEGRVGLFLSRVSDAIQRVDHVEYDADADTWLYQLRNAGEVEHRGVEIGASRSLGDACDAGVDYAYLRRRNRSNPELKPTDTPEHRVLAHVRLRPCRGLTVSPNVEISSSRYSTSDGVRTGGFQVFNLNAILELGGGWTLSAGVLNVLDRDYALTEGYPEGGRSFYARVDRAF